MSRDDGFPGPDPVALIGTALDGLTLGAEAKVLAAEVRTRLSEPLRVVVAGRLKAGKSTLVNSLLGQRVAPTDVSECTRLVTWFRYGNLEHVEARLRDGTTKALQFESDGTLPTDPGLRPADVERLDVWLSNDTLRAMTLIDTPGLASTDAVSSQATRKLLSARSKHAAAEADALLFVLNGGVRADERAVLKDFAAGQGVSGSAVNSLAVLTKADQVGEDGGLEQAALLAKRVSERLADEISIVLPFVGLWAECAQTGAVTEQDAELIHELAALDDAGLDDTMLSSERFLVGGVGNRERRERLLRLVGLRGIEKLVNDDRSGSVGAVALREELHSASGLADLNAHLDTAFHRRSAPLRAWRALDELQRLAFRRDLDELDRASLRDVVERLRFDSSLHHVAELQAMSDLCTGNVELPSELAAELRRCALGPEALVDDTDITAGKADVAQAMRRWHAFALTASPRQARIARTLLRSYREASRRLT